MTYSKRACRKLWHRPHDGLYRPRFHALLTCGSPKQSVPFSPTCSRSISSKLRKPSGKNPCLAASGALAKSHSSSQAAPSPASPYGAADRVHASNRSDSRARPTTTHLGLEMGAYVSADEAVKLPDLA